MIPIGEREAAITQFVRSDEVRAALRKHLREIVEGAAFKGSHRSAKFLDYIVERAMAGSFDSLKERMIGIELFGRLPSYDTSEDAIVRVTASDVRKRLLQHYGSSETASQIRIGLPPGTYLPEFTRTHEIVAASGSGESPPGSVAAHPGKDLADPAPPIASTSQEHALDIRRSKAGYGRWWIAAAAFAVLNMLVWVAAWKHVVPVMAPASDLTWSALFASPHPTHLVASDPDIEAIQILTDVPLSLSDYANRRYLPESDRLPDPVKQICKDMLHGDKATTTDMGIAVDIAGLAKSYAKKIDVIGARDLQFSNLKTDDNFIFLGSPLSNPWFSAFNDQLDFRFVPEAKPAHNFSDVEIVRNFRPHPGEPPSYVPTAKGGATGESFAIVAMVGNPDQNGQVLLLAGANREGTQAAGKLVTNLPRLSAALRTCGLAMPGPLKHFEMLLRVDTMAGYATQTAVAACHLLPAPAPR